MIKYKKMVINEEGKFNHYVSYMDSPIGIIEIRADENKIISIDFVDKHRFIENNNDIVDEAKRQLSQYFKGERTNFDLPLNINGTEFQNTVWNELKNIPYGKTLSYKEVARNINNEKACRAVGNANNKNKIAIIIPCHRVVGSNGKLVGYEGGLFRKEWLLNHEKKYSM